MVVDTLGLIMAVAVTSAGLQDDAFEAAGHLFWRLVLKGWSFLKVIWADGVYEGSAVMWAQAIGGWALRVVKRTDDTKGFAVLPKRWVVERTFAWLGRFRRLSKDYEEHTANSEAMIRLAMISVMLRRIRPGSRTS